MFPIRVRGRHEEIIASNVLWRSDPDLTEINYIRGNITREREMVLKLAHQGEMRVLRSGGPGMRIGRDKDNDLVIESHFASRVHARVFAREGHFVLADQSSNGTYLLADGNSAEILLRRDDGSEVDLVKLKRDSRAMRAICTSASSNSASRPRSTRRANSRRMPARSKPRTARMNGKPNLAP